MYILILQGSYNVKMIKYEEYEEALSNYKKHQEAGRVCYLTEVIQNTV